MNCPRDNIPLIERRMDECYFHFCDRCHGMWFSEDGLKKYIKAKNRPRIVKPGEEPWVTHEQCDSPGLCPVDGITPMALGQHHGVCVDVCHEHKGLWLDRGELEKMIQGFQTGIGTGKPAQEFAGHITAELFLNFGTEVLFDVGAAGINVAVEVVPEVAEAVFGTIIEIVASIFG